jgi:arginase family enzyme
MATFLNWPSGTPEDVQPGMIAVVGAPAEYTGTTDGARYGPTAIRAESSLAFGYRYFENGPEGVVDARDGTLMRYRDEQVGIDVGDAIMFSPNPERGFESLKAIGVEIVKRGGLPVMLGGDHFWSHPMAAAVAEVRGGKLGYIHVDAHMDFQEMNPYAGRYYHGTPARRNSELPEYAVGNMAWLGLNDMVWIDEYRSARDGGATIIPAPEMRRDVAGAVERALETAGKGTDAVYMTIDIDVVDHAYAPGTGFTNFGGLTSAEFLEMMTLLGRYPDIAGIDLVEVSPPRDDRNAATANLAANGLVNILEPRIRDARTPV